MARYKLVDRSPQFLPIVLESQLIAGSFEHALDVLVDTEVDLARLAMRFCNDETGAPACDPTVMLKIVLLACSRGVVSSRAIERLCRENVLFMAISGDSAPRFTTIAKFVRELGDEAGAIFTQVLLTCDRMGLIGRQMFAIDGVKLPSNADKRRSGTRAELAHEAERTEKAVAKMVKAHRARDEANDTGEPAASAAHADPAGSVVRQEPELAARTWRTDEGGDRHRAWPRALRATNRDGGTGVCEPELNYRFAIACGAFAKIGFLHSLVMRHKQPSCALSL